MKVSAVIITVTLLTRETITSVKTSGDISSQ